MVHPTVANEYHADWYTTAPDGIDGVRQAARRNADDLWRQLDASVAGQTWLVGERFSTADILLLVQASMHWDCHAMIAREKHVGAIVRRTQARPAMAALLERHGVEPFAAA